MKKLLSGGALRGTCVSPLPCRKLQIARAEPLTTPPGFAIIIMLCGRGGIGIRVRLRGVSVTGYGFKSRRPHHMKHQLLIQRLVLFLCLMAAQKPVNAPCGKGFLSVLAAAQISLQQRFLGTFSSERHSEIALLLIMQTGAEDELALCACAFCPAPVRRRILGFCQIV